MRLFTEEQQKLICRYVDEGDYYLEASEESGDPFYVLKAINDEIKSSGLDEYYDLNSRGRILQQLYEEIYADLNEEAK